MKHFHFTIHYHTLWGQRVELLAGTDGHEPQAIAMTTADGTRWEATLDASDGIRHLSHTYRIAHAADGSTLRREEGSWRTFVLQGRTNVRFDDVWAERRVSPVFSRTPFAAMAAGSGRRNRPLGSRHLLLLTTPPLQDGAQWAVCGSTASLGAWQQANAVPMRRTSATEWALALSDDEVRTGFTYKYVLTLPDGTRRWEQGPDRQLEAHTEAGADVVRTDRSPLTEGGAVPLWKAAGAVVPVFSLRSRRSWGIGDFADLARFVRWAAQAGMKAVQLLPVNDTTTDGSWRDSYPYNPVSPFALHPVYIAPAPFAHTRAYARCIKEGQRLNGLSEVDYPAAFALKARFLHELYRETGKDVCAEPAFKRFCRDNAPWLEPYVQHCTLRRHYHTPDFRRWPRTATDAWGMADDMQFSRFVQYELHLQMLQAHAEAREAGVMLKGDIPIGVSPDGVTAWAAPRLLHFDGTAGAPPDAFAREGQNWGFPTYNWDALAADGYAWWRQRLGHMGRYFDAYRIDHVLGFFRIWEVPTSQRWGVMGHFRPALPFSEEELRQYGFSQPLSRATRPWVRGERMDELCHELGEAFRARFTPAEGGYVLEGKLSSQRAVEAEKSLTEAERRALTDICTEVLLIADPDRPDHYHPRVSARLTHAYRALSDDDRRAFDRLHDDFFYRRHDSFWRTEAMRRLPSVTNYALPPLSIGRDLPLPADTGMLPCAEDLGMVPACVRGVLEETDVLSLEIERMPKGWGHRFAPPSANPYVSVATIATHDMPPLRLWWTESEEQTRAYWHEALGHKGEPPAEATPQVCEEVIRRHLDSPSMLCLLGLQDWTAVAPTTRSPHPADEQVNHPSDPHQRWRYRMHLTIEQLEADTAFNEKLRGMIRASGR